MSDRERAAGPIPADDDPELLRQCTCCYAVRYWIEARCECGNYEFSLPPFPSYTLNRNQIVTAITPERRAKKATAKTAKPAKPHLENDTDPERKEFVAAFEADAGEVLETILIPLETLHPSPYQPRRVFDEAELDELAELLKAHGQLTSAKVRKVGEKYELIAGERRWRAAPRAGMTSLRCDVVAWSDERCETLALIDNLGRKDLSPLEEIRACRKLLDRGIFKKQLDLAKALSRDPATLSNQLRVLELPDVWLLWISQEMFGLTVTHSRSLLKWVHRPKVLQSIAEDLIENNDLNADGTTKADGQKLDEDEVESFTVAELERTVNHHARYVSRGLSGYDSWGAHAFVYLSKKEAADPDLDLEKVDGELRAFNLEVWQKHQDAALAHRKTSGDDRPSGSSTSRPAKSEKEKADDKAQQRAKRLYRHRIQTLQKKIAVQLVASGLSEVLAMRLMTWFYFRSPNNVHHKIRRDVWSASLQKQGAKRITEQYHGDDAWAMSLKVDDKAFTTAVHQALISIVSTADFETYSGDMTPEGIEQIAELLGVKFETDWQPTEEFLKLLSVEDLWQLDNEWATHLEEAKHPTKSKLIEGLLKSNAKRPFPNALRKLKAVRL